MGLDIIGWLNVVGMSHMVDRGVDSVMNWGCMGCMMHRSCMNSMMHWSRDSMSSMNG